MQLDLFEYQENENLLQLAGAVDKIRNRFGTAAIIRASSYTEAGIIIDRAEKIEGHYE